MGAWGFPLAEMAEVGGGGQRREEQAKSLRPEA